MSSEIVLCDLARIDSNAFITSTHSTSASASAATAATTATARKTSAVQTVYERQRQQEQAQQLGKYTPNNKVRGGGRGIGGGRDMFVSSEKYYATSDENACTYECVHMLLH